MESVIMSRSVQNWIEIVNNIQIMIDGDEIDLDTGYDIIATVEDAIDGYPFGEMMTIPLAESDYQICIEADAK